MFIFTLRTDPWTLFGYLLTRLPKPDWRCQLSSVPTASLLFSVFISFSLSCEQTCLINSSHVFFWFFLRSCWTRHILQRQLRFPCSRLCDTNLGTRHWGALPFTSGRTLPSVFTLQQEWSNVDRFKCIPGFRVVEGFEADVSVSSASGRSPRPWLPPFFDHCRVKDAWKWRALLWLS